MFFENLWKHMATRHMLRDVIYNSTVAFLDNRRELRFRFHDAFLESEETVNFSKHRSTTNALVWWVSWAKANGENVGKVSLFNFLQSPETFVEPSTRRKTIRVAKSVFDLTRIAIVPSSTAGSDEDTTEETGKIINVCSTPIRVCRVWEADSYLQWFSRLMIKCWK